MEDEPTLFELTNSYDISKLKEQCRSEIKKNNPKPVDGEEYCDYITFIEEESDLLYASRLKEIAQQIEDRIYGEQHRTICEIYRVDKEHQRGI